MIKKSEPRIKVNPEYKFNLDSLFEDQPLILINCFFNFAKMLDHMISQAQADVQKTFNNSLN